MMAGCDTRDAAEDGPQGGCCGFYSLISRRRRARLHPNRERSIPTVNSANTVDLNDKEHHTQDNLNDKELHRQDELAGNKPLAHEELPEVVEQHDETLSTKCIFCEGSLCEGSAWSQRLESMPLERLKDALGRSEVDIAWCVEKEDLVQVQKLASAVCSESDCRELLKLSCTRTLECGHRCGGVRAERTCLPCVEDGCQSGPCAGQTIFTSGDELCAICMVDPIRRAPAILLTCGHVVHAHCAKRKIDLGFPGPEISFGFLECALCSQVMQHPVLQPHAMKYEKMRDLVRQRAIERLLNEERPKIKASLKRWPWFKKKASSQPSQSKVEEPSKSKVDETTIDKSTIEPKEEITEEKQRIEKVHCITEELVIAAMKKYQYYMCSRCKEPYFGGIRNCRAGIGREDGDDQSELVCGGCSAAANGTGKCKVAEHGTTYFQYKCRYCCAMAIYECNIGRLHVCASHHIGNAPDPVTYPECPGPEHCPLGIEHAPNGEEFCLGCSLCRMQGQ